MLLSLFNFFIILIFVICYIMPYLYVFFIFLYSFTLLFTRLTTPFLGLVFAFSDVFAYSNVDYSHMIDILGRKIGKDHVHDRRSPVIIVFNSQNIHWNLLRVLRYNHYFKYVCTCTILSATDDTMYSRPTSLHYIMTTNIFFVSLDLHVH
jgi:hypothetical protein